MKRKKKDNDSFYLTYIDSEGEEHPCHTDMNIRKKLKLTADNKLTILLALWILDKIVMLIFMLIFNNG